MEEEGTRTKPLEATQSMLPEDRKANLGSQIGEIFREIFGFLVSREFWINLAKESVNNMAACAIMGVGSILWRAGSAKLTNKNTFSGMGGGSGLANRAFGNDAHSSFREFGPPTSSFSSDPTNGGLASKFGIGD